MANRYLQDLAAVALQERRQESMHVVEIGEAEISLARKKLDAAAAVDDAVTERPFAQRIGDPRRQAFYCAVLPAAADAGDHGDRREGLCRPQVVEQQRNVGGMVLAVAVHGQHELALGMHDAGVKGRALTAALGMEVAAKVWIEPLRVNGLGAGLVDTAVIDADNFEGLAAVQGFMQLLQKEENVFFFVVQRNDNG